MLTTDSGHTRTVGATERDVLVTALEIASAHWGARSEAAFNEGNINNEVVYRMQANQADNLADTIRQSRSLVVVGDVLDIDQ